MVGSVDEDGLSRGELQEGGREGVRGEGFGAVLKLKRARGPMLGGRSV